MLWYETNSPLVSVLWSNNQAFRQYTSFPGDTELSLETMRCLPTIGSNTFNSGNTLAMAPGCSEANR